MKIAVDGFDLVQQSTGVGRFLKNLLPELLKNDPENSYHLFLREDNHVLDGFANLEKTIIPEKGGYSFWQNGPLRKKLVAGGYDLLFAPNGQLPFVYRGRSVLVIHDVSWKAIPSDFSWKERTGKDIKCRWSLKRAERVTTDAEFTKTELIGHYRVKAEKIQAIPLAIEPCFRRQTPEAIAAFKIKYGLRGKKIIGFLGSVFGRRHVRELIQAFGQLRKKHELTLVIVGKNSAGSAMADALRQEGVVWIDWLPEEQLNSFYSALDLFVYISDYEGFGFPPLEALACGTISLLLPTSSLREMYHDLALFVAVPEPGIVAQAIGRYLETQEADTRKILAAWEIRKDYFSWQRVAAAYLHTMLPR